MKEVEELIISLNDGVKQIKYYLSELLVYNNSEYAVFFNMDNEFREPILLKIKGDMLVDIEDENEYNRVKSYWDKLDELVEEEKTFEEDNLN